MNVMATHQPPDARLAHSTSCHNSCTAPSRRRSNVAQHCAQKLLDEGALVLGMSDSHGYIFESGGLTREQLAQVGGWVGRVVRFGGLCWVRVGSGG